MVDPLYVKVQQWILNKREKNESRRKMAKQPESDVMNQFLDPETDP